MVLLSDIFSGCGKGSVDTTIPEGGENIRKVELGADLAKSNPLFMGIKIRKWKIETVTTQIKLENSQHPILLSLFSMWICDTCTNG